MVLTDNYSSERIKKSSFDDLDVRKKCFIFVKIVPHKGAVIRLRMEDNPAFMGAINELWARL
jgi:hypothetical protein